MPSAEAPLDNFDSSTESSQSNDYFPVNRDILQQQIAQNQNQNGEQDFFHSSDSSISLDVDEDEEDNQSYLLPVELPNITEPTLDELLRRITGRHDIHNVDTVKLRVISYMVSLCRLSLFMPNLVHLDLSGSVLNSLRDLGCGLMHLTHLNVSNCGLSSFDGTSGIPMTEVLIADGNMIQLVGPLSNLPLLRKLSVQNNRIIDLGMLSFLGMCPNLVDVDLRGNPVTHFIMYQKTIEKNVENLERLDGFAVDEEPQEEDEDFPDSFDSEDPTELDTSLSDEIYSEFGGSFVSIASAALMERPSTCDGFFHILSDTSPKKRPASTPGNWPKRPLYPNAMVGSVISIARMRKWRQDSEMHMQAHKTDSDDCFLTPRQA